MTRKDYVLIAAAIKSAPVVYAEGHMAAQTVAESIADALAAENPRFDRARFLKAAGVQQ